MKQLIERDIVFKEKLNGNYLSMRFNHEWVEQCEGITRYYLQALGMKEVFSPVLSIAEDSHLAKRFRKGKLSYKDERDTYGSIGISGLIQAKKWLLEVQQELQPDQIITIYGLDQRRSRVYQNRLCREEGCIYQPTLKAETDTYFDKVQDCVIAVHPSRYWDVLEILTAPKELEKRMKTARKKNRLFA